MEGNFSKVNEKVQNHLKQLAGSVKVASADGEENEPLEVLAQAWLEKEERFNNQMNDNNMELVDSLSQDDAKGCLVLTYSGSLLTIGPLTDGGRKVEYVSVGLRTDVPDAVEQDDSQLASDVSVDQPAEFTNGPIQKSSPIYKIAVVKEDMDPEEEEELLSDVTQVLIDEFADVNKTMIIQ
jgi:hypothetical protein